MRNEDTAKIVEVLDTLLGSFNISDMNKLKEVHQNGWKEFLNGNMNSQLAANKAQKAQVTEIVEALPENVVQLIMNAIGN